MGGESNGITGGYSTEARHLGGPVRLDSDTRLFRAETNTAFAADEPITTTKPPAVPPQTLRLNPAGAQAEDGDPFRYDTSIPGNHRVYMQQPSRRDEDGQQRDPTLVRVAGDRGPVRYNVSANASGVVGAGAAITSDDRNISAAVTVSHNTNDGVANPTTLGANAYVLIPGTDVGAYAGVTDNRLNSGEPGTGITEVGAIVTPGGRADNLQPANSLIVGYRQRHTETATGNVETEQVFVRANAFPIGSVTTSGEVALDDAGVQVTLDASAKLGPNTSMRFELSGRTNQDAAPTGSAAFLFRHDF